MGEGKGEEGGGNIKGGAVTTRTNTSNHALSAHPPWITQAGMHSAGLKRYVLLIIFHLSLLILFHRKTANIASPLLFFQPKMLPPWRSASSAASCASLPRPLRPPRRPQRTTQSACLTLSLFPTMPMDMLSNNSPLTAPSTQPS